ncbi:MAG: TonB-dependent receptor, partial [Gemmatimonadales bacterium]
QAEVGRWDLSLGARYDYRRLIVEDDPEIGVIAQRRTYNSVTGNLGVLYRIAEPVAVVFNLGRGFRSPSAFDLFSNGVHEGTVRFERGDSTLRNDLGQRRPGAAGAGEPADRRGGSVRQLHQ